MASEPTPTLQETEELAAAAEVLVELIKPILAGKDVKLQGLTLVNLVTIWVGGHIVVGDPKATRDAQNDLIRHHARVVSQLAALKRGEF